MLSDRIEDLARLYEAARKPGIADWDYRDFMVRVVDDWPVILPVLRAAAAYVDAKAVCDDLEAEARRQYGECGVVGSKTADAHFSACERLWAAEKALIAAVEEAQK